MGHLVIFAGAFGSGKSEVAVNYAVEKARYCSRIYLADLDMSSPYFVCRDAWSNLSSYRNRIQLIAPDQQLAMGDIPNLPHEIMGFIREDNQMIIDVAGDETGALVLGYMSPLIQSRKPYDLYMVINPFRPFSSNFDEVEHMRYILEKAANMRFTGIISNPNLVEETTVAVITEGHKKVLEFSRKMNIPVRYLTVEEKHYSELFPHYGNCLKNIQLYLRPDWL